MKTVCGKRTDASSITDYCTEPSWGASGALCRDHAFPAFADAIEFITGTCPHDVFYRTANYGAGDYPEALLLHTDGESVVHVSYDGSYESAYLFAEPAEHECPNQAGFTPGWEC